jgi:hypothetical protein
MKNALHEDMQCCTLPLCRPGAISSAAEAWDVGGVVQVFIEGRCDSRMDAESVCMKCGDLEHDIAVLKCVVHAA